MFKSLWAGLGRGARIGFIGSAVAILCGAAAAAYWLLRTDYHVLFSELSAADAAAMTQELEQMKVPYRLDAAGTAILVERDSVHPTRLKLMGRDLPLHGAVGFELFNTSDFGMTEFAQKINYQRALQGELTRTILSLTEVSSARVHVALPEDGLFRGEQGRAKASITLALRNGHVLRREQVLGIQRLVAAAIPGIQGRDVTLINQHGVALTHESDESATVPSSLRLELKQEIEQQLAKKANALLEKAYGPGQAMASVDVTLDLRHVKVTTEDVTTPPSPDGEGATGVVVRERESTREAAATGRMGAEDGIGNTIHRELEYQVGRRVEQVVTSPGAITRLHALAILRAPLNPAQADQLRKVLASAVGAAPERGDTVTVQSLEGLASLVEAAKGNGTVAPVPTHSGARAEGLRSPESGRPDDAAPSLPASIGLLIALAAAGIAGVSLLIRPIARRPVVGPPELSSAERQAGLAQVQAWLDEAPTPAPGAARR